MRKDSEFVLKTTTDIKVFLLFILDNIGRTMDRDTLIEIVERNTDVISFDYDECLRQMTKTEHLYSDELDGVLYYMITEKGRMVAAELYDTLDKNFRERSLRSAIRYITIEKSGSRINAYITETECKRFKVTLEAYDKFGLIMSTSVVVNSRSEAEVIKTSYEAKPDGVYRGVMFSVTGRLGFIS